MTVGERLKQLRLSKKLKQENLAKVVNRSPQAYSQYELGKRHPDLEVIKIIAEYYGVSTDYLICLTDDPTPYYVVKPNNLKELNISGMSKDKIDVLVALTRIFKQ